VENGNKEAVQRSQAENWRVSFRLVEVYLYAGLSVCFPERFILLLGAIGQAAGGYHVRRDVPHVGVNRKLGK
jgi:hypothetical protein